VKILVTGATAQPGRALIAALLHDPSVELVLAAAIGERGALPQHPRLVFHRADLTRSRAVHDLMHGPVRALGVDAVVHGVLHRRAGDEGHQVHEQNVEVTRALLATAAEHPTVRRFVFRSSGAVYAVRPREPNLLDEEAALELDPAAPQWVRDRVEADLTACAHLGDPRLQVVVLRCAEILAPEAGSQLWDYLRSRVCLRPMGFDPMLDVLSLDDAVDAMRRALAHGGHGVFNVPGADRLPLSRVARRWGGRDIPVPGPLLAPLYRWRTRAVGFDFRYDLNLRRFHFGGMLDGRRAAAVLGYRPGHPLPWHGSCSTSGHEGDRGAGEGALPRCDDRVV
jgi:UDP-glucose 4-epimerase